MTAHLDTDRRPAVRPARRVPSVPRRWGAWVGVVFLALLWLLPAPAAAQSAQVSLQATPSPFVPSQSIAITASGQISWSPMLWCTQPCYPVAAYSTIQIWGTGGYYAFADAWDEEVALQTSDPGPGQTMQARTYTLQVTITWTLCYTWTWECEYYDEYIEYGSQQVTVHPQPVPAISGLNPSAAITGTAVTISGSHFTGTQGTVTFNGTGASITGWSDTSITATVPGSATTGVVIVTVGGQASNGAAFTVTPQLSSLNPSSEAIGQSVTLQGTGFGASQGGSTVTFNGTPASVTQWSSTSVTATVPVGATSGSVVVTVGGYASNGEAFTVIAPPQISGMTPGAGVLGQAVLVSGLHFGLAQGTSTVTFNGVPAAVTSWTDTGLAVLVPPTASSGPVVVTVNGTAGNGWPFSIVVEQTTYYHTDAIGSIRMTTDAAGAVVARYDYLPFGQPWPSDSDPEPRRFAGMERDLETGSGSWAALDYFGARYYSSQSGRFTAVDPIVNPRRSVPTPQRWNRYTYVINNPLRFIDPDGRETQLLVGTHTEGNPMGHTALAINGVVFSFGSNYTKGQNRDWGADLKAYLDAQASLRETDILTLDVSPEVEAKLLNNLQKSDPYGPGARGYSMWSNSCVTVCERHLRTVGLIVEQLMINGRGEETALPLLTPAELEHRVRSAGLVTESTTVGKENASWFQSMWSAIPK